MDKDLYDKLAPQIFYCTFCKQHLPKHRHLWRNQADGVYETNLTPSKSNQYTSEEKISNE